MPVPGLDAVVEAANRLYVAGALETALAIAELVLDRLLGGDETALEEPQNVPSLRRLAARPDLRFSPSFLWTALAVRRQLPLLPEELRQQLTLTHHRLLLGIPDPRAKTSLARRAVRDTLDTRALSLAVSRWRTDHGLPPFGRPPTDPAVKALRRAAAALHQALEALDDPPSPGLDRADLPRLLQRAERSLVELKKQLEIQGS